MMTTRRPAAVLGGAKSGAWPLTSVSCRVMRTVAVLSVDVAAAERDELAPAQAAEAGEQDQGVVARAAGVGERVDLGDRQQRPLG